MRDERGDQALFERLRTGDPEAARLIFERHVEKLLALARRRISERLGGRVDPEDVVQSVFRTFFKRAADGQYAIQEQEDLCKLLARITVHKTLRQVEFHQAAKRDMHLETPQGEDAHQRLLDIASREPTPETVNIFLDQLEHFLQQLQPQERQILELRMQGYETEEIASRLGTYDRKIRRVMERIRSLAESEGLSAGL